MSTVPIQRLSDWIRSELSGVHPRLVAPFADPEEEGYGLASLELLPDDLSANRFWRDVDAFGDPEAFPLELPARPTGRLVFAAEESSGAEETCQNLTPFPGEAHSWTGFQPMIRGFGYLKNARSAAFPRPDAPILVNVPIGNGGYPAGDCTLFRCLTAANGKLLTTPDEGIDFSLVQGQGFGVPAERNLPRGVRVAYFLGYGDTPSKRYANAREQRVAGGGRREISFTGPYRNGRKLQDKNRTVIEPPREARRRRDFRFAPKNGGGVDRAEVRIIWTYATLRGAGETEGSRPSDRFDAEPGADKALWVDPPPRRTGADGWKLYVVINNVPYLFHRLGDPAKASGFLPFGTGRVPVHVDAAALAGEVTGGQGGAKRGKDRIPRWGLTQMDPPGSVDSEAVSGIEPLEGSLPVPTTFQVAPLTFAQDKTYTFRIADCAEDASGRLLQSLPSRRVKHFVPAGFAPRVIFPDPINELENAEGREIGADGKPVAWGFAEANGGYTCEGGVHEVKTLASGPTSSSFWQIRDVDQTRDLVFAGEFEAVMGSGAAEVLLQEYGVPAGEVTVSGANPTPANRTTVLASGSAVRTAFARILGTGADATPWHEDTVSWRFFCRMTGATRNGRVSVTNPLAGTDGVAPRKVEEGGPHEFATFSPSPERPYPRGPLAELGPAPLTGGEVSVAEPFETLDFVNGEPGASPSGQAWTKETSRATASVVTLPDGTRALRTTDNTMSQAAFARYW